MSKQITMSIRKRRGKEEKRRGGGRRRGRSGGGGTGWEGAPLPVCLCSQLGKSSLQIFSRCCHSSRFLSENKCFIKPPVFESLLLPLFFLSINGDAKYIEIERCTLHDDYRQDSTSFTFIANKKGLGRTVPY
jgi:hypothetical protein